MHALTLLLRGHCGIKAPRKVSRCRLSMGTNGPWSHMSMSMVQILLPSINRKHHKYVQAAAMMHGMSMAPASSVHGGCPSIAEHQEFAPCMPPPEMTMMQHDVITPNPGYKVPANLWDLNIAHCAHAPSPLATLFSPLQHYGESVLSNVQQARCFSTC